MNCTKRFISLVLILAALTGTLVLTTNASDSVKSAIGIVDASALRLRAEPSTSSEIRGLAYRDDFVVILEAQGDWYKVIYNLKEGYMHSDYLIVKERENVELGYGQANAYCVNMRSKPTTSSSVVTQLYSGEEAYIIGFNCGWYKVKFDGETGYIRSDLLDLTEIPYENSGSSNSPKYFVGGDPISSGSGSSSGASSGSSSGASAAPSSSAGQEIVDEAMKYLGVPYVWGGSSPSGFDCSGYVQYVMRACGYSINRTASAQLENGYAVSYDDLQPGDLVFFHSTYTTSAPASHVGIYIGDGEFIHSGSSYVSISSLSSSYYASRYLCARRIAD